MYLISSLSGKSHLIAQMIRWRSEVFSADFKRIMYFMPLNSYYSRKTYLNGLKDSFPGLEVFEGLPKMSGLGLQNNTVPSLLIIEDLADKLLNDGGMLDLFFMESHHLNVSVLYRYLNLNTFFLPFIIHSAVLYDIVGPSTPAAHG